MRLVDAEPIEKWLLSHADQVPGEDPYRRVRICAYRHAFEALHSAPTVETAVAESSKDPLTLEELREMDGEPVYLVFADNCNCNEWAIVHLEWRGCKPASGGAVFFDRYGERWLAYRRKPEEGTT